MVTFKELKLREVLLGKLNTNLLNIFSAHEHTKLNFLIDRFCT